MLVRDIMTEVVQFVDVTAPLREVIVIFEAEDIRHLPVLRGTKLMGMVSSRDVRALGRYLRGFLEGSDEQTALDLPISDFMQPDVVSLAPESSLIEAIDLLVHLRVGAAPVITLKNDELVGIVSYVDLLAAARACLERDAQ